MIFKNTNNTRILVRKTCILLLEPCILFTDPPLVFSIPGYHASCNGWKPGSAHSYRLSPAQMALPMIQELDYNLVDQPLNPNVSAGLGFQLHSEFADPGFQRTNPPWRTNWTDFVATASAAKAVQYTPIALAEIGLGPAFAFDRSRIGRRLLFREGDPGAELGEKNQFEDEDRVRGLVKAPSAGLLSVPPGGAWPHGGFPTAPGAWAVYNNRVFNSGGASTATVIIRANVAGECEATPRTACDPSKAPAGSVGRPHRFWRVDARPEYFDHSVYNPVWDVCSLDFFGSADGRGPSLLPADKGPGKSGGGGMMISSKAGSWPDEPTCNLGNKSTWAKIHGGMSNRVENWVGWDFGSNSSAAIVRSVAIKQFDAQSVQP